MPGETIAETTPTGTIVSGALGGPAGLAIYHWYEGSFTITPYIDAGLTYLANNIVLPLANLFLSFCGVILNGVMILTLNMSSLVSGTGNIVDSAWSIIRDISSILIIFFLLYVSIEIIIQQNDSKVKHLIIMVVVAGVLINFSLFFTKVAVDASNLVSLAFYRAIAPNGANYDFSQPGSGYIANAFTSGGLSDEFMSALKIQEIYKADPTTSTTTIQSSNTSPISIILAAGGGVMIMFLAGLSFLAASILFAVRIGLLIILMAFSPFYFLGMIIPKIKEKISDKWKNLLIDQCMILPIYMLFMYVALRIITSSAFTSFLNPPTGQATVGTSWFNLSIVGLYIEYIIAIILINIPLIAALEYASVGKDWANAIVKKGKEWSVRGIQKGAQQTVGRGANFIQNQVARSKFAENNPNAALLFNKAAGVVSTASFGDKKSKGGFVGGEKKKKEGQDKARKDLYERMDVKRENFPIDEEGQKQYETAKKAAFERQNKFIENMKTETIMSHMMGENPNARSHYELEKDYQGDYGKEYGVKIGDEMKENKKELEKIAELLNPDNTLKRLGQDRSVETLKADQTKLEARNKELDRFRTAADRQKEAAVIKELAKSVAEMNKKDKPEESSDSKNRKSSKDESGDKGEGEDKK
jgi:hypothetical protein